MKKKKKFSETPGKGKVYRCKADHIQRFYAKRSRAYKEPGTGVAREDKTDEPWRRDL